MADATNDTNGDLVTLNVNRRGFLAAAATCACALTCPFAMAADDAPAAAAAAAAPAGPTDIGPLADLAKKDPTVIGTWSKKPTNFLVVVNDGKVYAPTSVCTHKKKRVDPAEGGKSMICSAHDSPFDLEGVPEPVTADGDKTPAKEPLPRHGISVDAKGHVIVDPSKKFAYEQWSDKGSFVALKK